MTPITYMSEQPHDYAFEIDGAETLNKLRSVTADWRELAEDALECANNMTAEDFDLFRKGLKKERKGVFAGEKWSERFADILMPALMLADFGKDGVHPLRMNYKRGISDLIGQMRDGRFLACEVKREGAQLMDHQRDFLNEVRANGGVAFVARSVDDAEKALARS